MSEGYEVPTELPGSTGLCVFINLDITTQSGPFILVILITCVCAFKKNLNASKPSEYPPSSGIIDSFGLVFFIFRDPFFFPPTYEVKVLRIF